MPDNGRGPLLDTEQAAQYLAVDVRRIRELWQRRALPGIKVGRTVRFSTADLDEFIDTHRRPAAQ